MEITSLQSQNNRLSTKLSTLRRDRLEKRNFMLKNIKILGKSGDFYFPRFWLSKKRSVGEYTLVSQMSLPRLDRIGLQALHWREMMSIGLFIHSNQFETQFNSSLLLIHEHLSRSFNFISGLEIHLHISSEYKINSLRNFAFEWSRTEFVLLVDIDWIVSENIHNILKEFGPPPLKTAYCLMTFDMKCPETSPTLSNCNVTTFYRHGQHRTNPTEWKHWWKQAIKPYSIEYSWPYEPYIITPKSDVPRYRTRFDFGGNDKVSHILEYSLQGGKMMTLPFAYVSHFPHRNVEKWHTRSYERAVELWHQYVKELRVFFPGQVIRDHYLPWDSECSLKTCL